MEEDGHRREKHRKTDSRILARQREAHHKNPQPRKDKSRLAREAKKLKRGLELLEAEEERMRQEALAAAPAFAVPHTENETNDSDSDSERIDDNTDSVDGTDTTDPVAMNTANKVNTANTVNTVNTANTANTQNTPNTPRRSRRNAAALGDKKRKAAAAFDDMEEQQQEQQQRNVKQKQMQPKIADHCKKGKHGAKPRRSKRNQQQMLKSKSTAKPKPKPKATVKPKEVKSGKKKKECKCWGPRPPPKNSCTHEEAAAKGTTPPPPPDGKPIMALKGTRVLERTPECLADLRKHRMEWKVDSNSTQEECDELMKSVRWPKKADEETKKAPGPILTAARNNRKYRRTQLKRFRGALGVHNRATAKLKREAPRGDWTKYFPDVEERMLACILSAACRDTSLFRIGQALQAMGWLNFKVLADERMMGAVQDLVLGMGFNFWGKAGMKLCGASEYLLRHKANNNEELPPPTMDAWIQCPGCSRKVASLVLMDAFCKPGAITGDTHVGAVGPAWGWADGKGEDTIAREIEGFIPIEHWRDVNTVFAGMRQLWWDDKNKEETRRIIYAEALEANNWKDIKRLLDAGRKKEAVPPF